MNGKTSTEQTERSQASDIGFLQKWETLPDRETVSRTIRALRSRGVNAELVPTRHDALELLSRMIPENAELMTGASRTLEEIGFIDVLKSGGHKWRNLKDQVLAEKDPVKQMELRRRSVSVDYFLGSVHAISETGEVFIASASGSQIPSYAYSSKNVIWVSGTQKIVPSFEEGLKRVRAYALARESDRMRSLGFPGSIIGKLLIFEREPAQMQRKVSLILVNERLGF